MDDITLADMINDPVLWLIALPLVSVVVVMTVFYIIISYRNAAPAGLTKAQCNQGLRTGILSSIGPSLSVFIVVFSMASLIGGPLTWMRFSVIGAAPVDLAAFNLGNETYFEAMGELGKQASAVASGFWTMSINSCGWLIVVFFLNHRMGKLREKVGGGNPAWLGLISITAMLGLFGYLSTPFLLAMNAKTAACLGGAISMATLTIISRKVTAIRDYVLGIAIIIGIFIGYLFM